MELSFLNEKMPQIDEHINRKEFAKALSLIDEVLEWMPGWEIGEKIAQSGEIYWKKLLAETHCKNGRELLCKKDKHLRNYPAFNNAVKYANENPKYALVEKIEISIEERLESAFAENELKAKRETDVEKKTVEYQKKLNELRTTTQKNIARLEAKEKEICEQIIDCEIIAGEHKYALENLLSEAQKVSNNHRNEITKEEKEIWEDELNNIQEYSNLEYKDLQDTFSSHPKFLEYSRLVNEQNAICEEINQNQVDLNKLNSEMGQLVSSIKRITDEYAKARTDARNGSYANAKLLLKEGFDEIIKQSFERR